MDDLLMLVGLLILIASMSIYFLVPDAINSLAFSGTEFFKGQVWRIFTFSFVHVDIVHLIGNMIALGIVGLLAFELNFSGKYFLLVFMLSVMLIALLGGIILPMVIIAGASLGLYAVLGGLTLKGEKFLPRYFLILLMIFGLFLNYMFNRPDFSGSAFVQTIFHFIGFLVGILVIEFIIQMEKRKIRIFSEVSK